jgi:hypothetical protein
VVLPYHYLLVQHHCMHLYMQLRELQVPHHGPHQNDLSRSIESCIFIEGDISTSLDLLVAKDVDYVCILCLTISKKYTLLA